MKKFGVMCHRRFNLLTILNYFYYTEEENKMPTKSNYESLLCAHNLYESIITREEKFIPTPRNVYYNKDNGVTVVIWNDKTKTIVRPEKGKSHSAYHGYCVALAKKIHGTNSKLQKDLKKILVVQSNKKEK